MRAFFIKNRLLFFHLAFWFFLISYRLFDMTRFLPLNFALTYLLVPMLFNILISYLHYFFLIPILFKKRHILLYISFLSVLLVVFLCLRFSADHYFMAPISPDKTYYASIHLARVVSVLWGFLSFIILTMMIKLAVNWFDLENKQKKLENEKLNAELNYLKAQINPHFLFNTLHNLNYLALRKDDATSSIIIRLSNIMRYMIYEANKEAVSIQLEIDYMQDYIELERIRLNQPFTIDFTIDDQTRSQKIAPLLLFTCLENAFKHGVNDQSNNCWIRVDLSMHEKELNYIVRNSKVFKLQSTTSSGFGLINLEKRLHLHYPDRHQLEIEERDDYFQIQLKIQMT